MRSERGDGGPDERPVIALEISSLGELYHTGIPNVAKRLAIELLNDDTVDGRFFCYRQMIPRSLIEKIVQLDGCNILWWATGRCSFQQDFENMLRRPVVGVYANHKNSRRLFPFEVLIVHDLTPVVTPQFQVESTIKHWESRMLSDLLTSDLIVTVSASTEQDIRTYYPQVSHVPSIVSLLAPSRSGVDITEFGFDLKLDCEPFVVVLGTLEPRKNVRLILQFVAQNRHFLATTKFVFIGRWGWGETVSDLVEQYGIRAEVESGRVIFAGFVSDTVKDMLVANARCVVYPSRYEGFGLPLIEALSVGTPVLTTYSSSLPEAAGDFAYYFDMDSVESFADALYRCLTESQTTNQAEEASRQRRAWAADFTWQKTYARIRDAALKLAGDPVSAEQADV